MTMTFWDHLEDLRKSIFRIAVAFIGVTVVLFFFKNLLFTDIILASSQADFFLYRLLGVNMDLSLVNIEVAAQFMVHVKVTFVCALILVVPYVIYELWRFIYPALYENERKSVKRAFSFASVLFYIGLAVGYAVIFPFTFRFLTEYQLSAEITNQISLNSYMGTFLMMVFVMGLVFEIPLLAWVMSKLGLIDKDFLIRYRRHAVAVMLILAAAITPTGDPFTLSIVFIPLYLLYELAIKIVASRPVEEDDDYEEVDG